MARRKARRENRLPLWILLLLFALVIALFLLPDKKEPEPPQGGSNLTVRMLDAGQADALLIQQDGKNMLIDAGKNSTAAELVETIKGYGVLRFDIVIATHPHEDHIGGLDEVILAFEIDVLIMPDVQANTKTYRDVAAACAAKKLDITFPEPGGKYTFCESEFTVLAPNGSSYDDTNNYSIVIKFTYVTTDFLFMGDAEALSEKEILNAGYDVNAEVLKVGHHGSTSSTSKAFLAAASPEIALISCGTDNSYGHPHEKTLNALVNAGVKVYRTDVSGTVTLVSDGKDVTLAA